VGPRIVVILYHFDLYPRDDPRDGARVVRFTKLQSAEYRGEANGTGAGEFTIRADVAEAQLIDPRGLQYVRVVREDTVAATELVVGGFFLDSGDFSMLDEQGTRLLKFGGAGTLSYLARSIMASHTYISPIFTGQDPFDDTWRLYAQSTVYANGNFLGAMLWRVIYEAQHNTPGTHRHADGVNVSDTHADDRPAIAIPDLVMTFDQFEDTNGNDWAVSSGEFKAQIGENVLGVVKRLMEAGLYVEMDPDTFELNAYPASTHRRNRTGGAWGTNVVRFQAPTDATIATGNIKSDAKRAITAFVKRSWLLAGGEDVFGDATGTTDIPWEGYYHADVNEVAAAANVASVQINARNDAGDTLRLRGKLGTTPTTGYYKPFEHVLLDDLATVHTGTDQFDHDEQDFPVAALTVSLRPAGDWDVWYELGASYSTINRQFQVNPVPAHNHPHVQLCQPGTPGTSFTQRLYLSFNNASISPLTNDAAWASGNEEVKGLTTSPDGSLNSTQQDIFTGVAVPLGNRKDEPPSYAYQITDSSLLSVIQAGGADFLMQVRARSRTGIGVDDAAQFNYPQTVIRIRRTSGGGSWVGTALAAHSGTPGTRFAQGNNGQNRIWSGTLSAVAGAALNDWIVVEAGTRHVTPISGASGAYWFPSSVVGASDLPANDETSFDTALNSWMQIATAGVGATGADLPLDTVHQDSESVGTSNRAARCDHQHAHGLLSDDGTHYHNVSQVEGLTDPVIDGFVKTTEGGQHVYADHGDIATSVEVSLIDGNVHGVTLTDDTTDATSGVESRFRLIMRQDSTGGWVPTFPASVIWPDDTEPTWSTDPNEVDIVEFTSVDGGTTWYGDAGGISTASPGATDLDDLTDVTITAPAEDDDLRYNGSQWVNDNRRWEAVTDGENVFVWDGDDLVHEWKAY
jgi:hypothetical protein